MSDDTLTNKQWDEAVERAESDTQAALAAMKAEAMPTEAQVLEAFDALGGNFNQPMALAKKLQSDGFAHPDVAAAINAALAAGVLIQVESGSIRKA